MDTVVEEDLYQESTAVRRHRRGYDDDGSFVNAEGDRTQHERWVTWLMRVVAMLVKGSYIGSQCLIRT
jgi:hypothetical protein